MLNDIFRIDDEHEAASLVGREGRCGDDGQLYRRGFRDRDPQSHPIGQMAFLVGEHRSHELTISLGIDNDIEEIDLALGGQ